jgi:hypothetical protein
MTCLNKRSDMDALSENESASGRWLFSRPATSKHMGHTSPLNSVCAGSKAYIYPWKLDHARMFRSTHDTLIEYGTVKREDVPPLGLGYAAVVPSTYFDLGQISNEAEFSPERVDQLSLRACPSSSNKLDDNVIW